MELNDNIDLKKRKYTSRLIVSRALNRGWNIAGFKSNPAIFKISIPGKQKPIYIFSASPPQMSYPASKIAKDKFITNCLLADSGLPVPQELLLSSKEDFDDNLLAEFMSNHKKTVVKPLDASHGNGITVNIKDMSHLKKSIIKASTSSNGSLILVQEQISGVDVRILCINYKFVDSISRIPAQVIGNGKNTISELVDIVNSHPDRGENYTAKLNYISVDMVEDYLGKNRFNEIPNNGEVVQVVGVSNVGMGGERHNINNDVPQFLKDLAIKASKTMELPVCGVDFMIKKLPNKHDNYEDLDPKIIEVNECPMLTMYDDLNSPEQHRVIDLYLDYLADTAS